MQRRQALGWLGGAGVAGLLAACQTAPVTPAASPPPLSPSGGPSATAPTPTAASASAPVALSAAMPAAAPRAPSRALRLGLALGGGAARGFAHIGVIQVLEEAGIRPDLVVGTSAGSLVAALYAAGKNGMEMGTLAQTMDESALTDWTFPGRGLVKGEALAKFVRDQTGGRAMEAMKLPLGIVATDLDSGSPILFQRGDVGAAVRASSAVPAVFQPVKIGAREYVDGGLVSPVPVRFARQMGADVVLAVDISSPPEGNATGDALRMLLQTFAIMGRSINSFELKDADVVLRPVLAGIGSGDFTARRKAIIAGRDAMLAALPVLRQRLATRSAP